MSISLKDAAEILLERKRVLTSLNAWAKANDFEPAAHHRLINEKLEAVERGEIKKLMLFLPPGSAKSTYASVLFPPWFLARKPNRCILACSYSYTLVESFGKRCRNVVDNHQKELNFRLKSDSRASGEWETTNGGRYFCAGVGAGIAGHRADLGVIDDPVGSREDADSDVYREKVWQWYLADFKPRLKPHASQVLIMTRWHEDDLAGRLLDPKNNEHNGWHVVSLPFYAKENDALGRQVGERLWSNWFTDEMFSHDARTANALYQCSPTAESGNFFDKETLLPYSLGELPKASELSIYVGSDHALTKKEDGDKTVHIPAGVDSEGTLWILPDVFWSQVNGKEAVDAMFSLIQRRSPIFWWAGKDHIETAIGPFLTARMHEESTYACLISLPHGNKDKRTRAQSIKGMMSMGKVRFPKFAPWWPAAEAELLSFDSGTHDDFVDALSMLGQGLSQMRRGQRLTPTKPEMSLSFRPTFRWLNETCARSEFAKKLELAKYDN